MNKPFCISLSLLALSALVTTTAANTANAATAMKLAASSVSQPIIIDGVEDSVWKDAKPLTVTLNEMPYKPSNGYDGIKSTDLSIRALYDENHLYMLLRYADPTRSLKRFPWVKQSDGTWKQMMDKDSTGHDNTWYEDKVALLWNINSRGFKKKGCDQSCHINEKGFVGDVKENSAGRHFTRNVGETLDAWHWKSVRTNPNFQMDDQYFNHDGEQQNKSWGRHSDHKSGGGYIANVNADKSGPAWMSKPGQNTSPFWIYKNNKVPFQDRFQPGDWIAGIVTAPFEGSRADVTSKGVWKDGYWTLEIKRALVTYGPQAAQQDVQFNNRKKAYRFGVTVFDNSQINHLYHKKSIELTFD